MLYPLSGSHRHGGHRGLAHGLKESDVAANISEGKHAPRRGNTNYISHEVGLFFVVIVDIILLTWTF